MSYTIKSSPAKRFVVFDLDGTLADITHRSTLLHTAVVDWNKFFKASIHDKPIWPVIRLLRGAAAVSSQHDYETVILTGRNEDVRAETIQWLSKYEVPFDHLVMRKSGDRRPDVEMKQDFIDSVGVDRIDYAVEDRQRVVDMWRSNGVLVLQSATGDF